MGVADGKDLRFRLTTLSRIYQYSGRITCSLDSELKVGRLHPLL